MKHELKTDRAAGFSLVEMLVVIAVIGIIAAIAVPSIGAISNQANTNKAKRNAQTIASIYNASRSVGAEYASSELNDIIDEMVAGKEGPELAGTEFRISSLSDDEKMAAMQYVGYNAASDLMAYSSEGGLAAAEALEAQQPEPEPAPDPDPAPEPSGWITFKTYPTEADAQNYVNILYSHPFFNHPTGYFSTDMTWRVGPPDGGGFPVQYLAP